MDLFTISFGLFGYFICIVIFAYIVYFLYLQIKLSKLKIKYYENQNKEFDNVGK
jgi:uncharacterized membrane protein